VFRLSTYASKPTLQWGTPPPYFTEPTARRYNKVLRMGLQESEKISENFRN